MLASTDDPSATPLPQEEEDHALVREASLDSQAEYTTAYSSFQSINLEWAEEPPPLGMSWMQLPLPPALWAPRSPDGHGPVAATPPPRGVTGGVPEVMLNGVMEDRKEAMEEAMEGEGVPCGGVFPLGSHRVVPTGATAWGELVNGSPVGGGSPVMPLGTDMPPQRYGGGGMELLPRETNGDHGTLDKLLLARRVPSGSTGENHIAPIPTRSPTNGSLSLQLAQLLSKNETGHDQDDGHGVMGNGSLTGAKMRGSPASDEAVNLSRGDESELGPASHGGMGGDKGGGAQEHDGGAAGRAGGERTGKGEGIGTCRDEGGSAGGDRDISRAVNRDKSGAVGEDDSGDEDEGASGDTGLNMIGDMGAGGSREWSSGGSKECSKECSKEGSTCAHESEITAEYDLPETPMARRRASDAPPGSARSSEIGASESDHGGELEAWEVQRYARVALLLSRRNPLRKACIKLVSPRYHGQYFDSTMVIIILLNCIFLALFRPTDPPDSDRNRMLDQVDKFFLAAFTAEMCIKVLAFGVCNYWRDHWNKLDALVVVTGYVSLLNLGSGTSSVRVLRVLRPLRAISILPGLRVLVGTILRSIPMLGNVLLLCLLFGVLFGILGISFFAGELRSRCVPLDAYPPPENYTLRGYLDQLDLLDSLDVCTNSSTLTHYGAYHCAENELCLRVGNPNGGYTSFDNFLWALLTILQCVTLEGWTDVMYWTQDGLSGWSFVYFLLLIFVGTFFLVNLLLAVIVYKHEESDETERKRQDQLEASSKASKDTSLASLSVKPTKLRRKRDSLSRFLRKGKRRLAKNLLVQKLLAPPPPGSFLYRPHRICDVIVHGDDGHGGKLFHTTIVVLILANTVVLSLEYHGMSDTFLKVLEDLNIALATSFIAEMVIKMFALGLGRYFDNGFHVFDTLVNVTSLVEMSLSTGGSLSALRGVRVLRVLKLVSKWSSLQIFLRTLWATVHELGNFFFIIALLLFVYALLGMQLFGAKLDFDGDGLPDERANFDTLLWSVVTVFQIITGENWNQLMYLGMRATNNLASTYFLSLILIGNYVVVNLFIAILLTSFERRRKEFKKEEEAKKAREAELAKLKPTQSGRTSITSLLPRMSRRGSATSVLDSKGGGTDMCDSVASRDSPDIDTLPDTLPPLGSPTASHHRTPSATVVTVVTGRVPASETSQGTVAEAHSDASPSVSVSGSRRSKSSPSLHPLARSKGRSLSSPVLSEMGRSQGAFSLGGGSRLTGEAPTSDSLRAAWGGAAASTKAPASRSDSLQAVRSEVSSISEDVEVTGAEGEGGGAHKLCSMKSWSFNKVLDEMGTSMDQAEAAATLQVGKGAPETTRRAGSFRNQDLSDDHNDLGALREEGGAACASSDKAGVANAGGKPHHRPTKSLSFNRRHTGEGLLSPLTPLQPKGKIKRQVSFHDIATEGSLKTGGGAASEGGSTGNPPKGVLKPSLSRTSVGAGFASSEDGSLTAAEQRERRERERAEEREMMRSMALENWSALAYKSHAREPQSEASSKDGIPTGAMDNGPRPTPPLESFTQRSFFLFAPGSAARQAAYRLVAHPWFERFIMATIIASSLVMAIESPATKEHERITRMIKVLEYVFVITFAIEMLLKVLAFGFVAEKGSYARDSWNLLDGFIVVVSLVNLALASANVEWARALRALRVLRPLRMISRIPELRIVVQALLASFPGLGNLLVVSALIWLIFAILGMSLFMGTFYSCTDPSVADREACKGTFLVDGVEVPRRWRNAHANFDNIVKAMMTLFELVNGEGWVTIMYAGVDAVGIDQQPRVDYDVRRVWFFVAFMLIGSFFILKLFIGIIMDNYSQMRERAKKGHLFMTERQRKWAEAQKRLVRTRPRRRYTAPGARWRKALYFLVNDPWLQKKAKAKPIKAPLPSEEPIPSFEYAVLAVILLNMVFMAMQHADQGSVWNKLVDDTNYAFVSFFLFELVLKLLAYGPVQYFADSWNRFDFLVVAVSVAELFFTFGTGVSVFRLLRLARFLRWVKSLRSLTTLFNTLLMSMPTLANVGGLMFLLLFIFSVLGVELFGKVTQHQEYVNRRTNFQNWGYAMLTLFRMCTGEGWNGIMYDCMVQPGDCVGPDGGPCCSRADDTCGRKAGFLYFIAFQVVATYIVVNLFLAVVLENYNKETRGVIVTDEDLEQFRLTWEKFDPEATMFLPVTKLFDLMREVPPPLGISHKSKPASQMELRMFLMSLNITLIGEGARFLFFQDVLTALTNYAHDLSMVSLPPAMLQSLHAQLGSLRQGASSRLDNGLARSTRDLTSRALSRISEKSIHNTQEDPATTGEWLARAIRSLGPGGVRSRRAGAGATPEDSRGNPGKADGANPSSTTTPAPLFCASDYFAAQVIESHIHRFLYRRRLNEYATLLRMRRKLAETQVIASLLADVKSALRRRVLSSATDADARHAAMGSWPHPHPPRAGWGWPANTGPSTGRVLSRPAAAGPSRGAWQPRDS